MKQIATRCWSTILGTMKDLFLGLAGAYVNPGSIFSSFLFMHSLCSLITHTFLNGFQPNLYQGFPHVSSTYHTIFSLK